MGTSAPYYQVRTGQFTQSNDANSTQPQLGPEDGDYDIPGSPAAVSPAEHLQASSDHTFEDTHNLKELLEAAKTARQASQAMDIDGLAAIRSVMQTQNKRRRGSTSSLEDPSPTHQVDHASNSKRPRVLMPTDPQLQDGDRSTREASGKSPSPTDLDMLKGIRPIGVHSAVALFRPASESTARKYTRPPMSKLFMSLQLSPESFLQLQAQAKMFMLDPAHPERQDCVGNRGKGDNMDMVKLRLFSCVQDFLNNGAGEQFFGERVVNPNEKEVMETARVLGGEGKVPAFKGRLVWPKDAGKIIHLVTPLLRRMVTNERQRQYAIETRKGGPKKKDRENSREGTAEQLNSPSQRLVDILPALDPHLIISKQISPPASPSKLSTATTVLNISPKKPSGSPDRSRETVLESETSITDHPQLQLPTEGATEPILSNINIFITLKFKDNKPGIKLDEARITPGPGHKHLAWYEWEEFLKIITPLLQRVKAKYPEIREKVGLQTGRIGAENLRGLAAAANALSGEAKGDTALDEAHRTSRTAASPEAEPGNSKHTLSAPPSSSAPNATLSSTRATDTDKQLPRYVIKTLGTDGWQAISGAKEWYDMLLEKAFAVWADGVHNVFIELVDVPGPPA
ncbi:hypothetical protein IQ07DRAFT_24186 [Pyrenochaeta sp. DS3sAY3a]|nr:hypothetical protein IQ07DRAFT_24186 [Pyrenochaeta sp. DS3sAY3a]